MAGIALITLTGCGEPRQSAVQSVPNEPGLYVVHYRWREVEERFGKDKRTMVPNYLVERNLVPSECVGGVTFVRGNELRGGGAWAEFRCRD